MAYIILASVLMLTAVLNVRLMLNRRNAIPVYWYIQPFIFPVLFIISALLEYFNVLAITVYIVMAGLVFQLISFMLKRKKRAAGWTL